ncbi:hypothetical protein ACFXKS_14715 [Streptomyces scopuliridis]|uniref:hypothetical protein n=1 Tax=Streptomyces scopuliridis TaxID=452529 RepID=UPI0036D1DE09
MARVTLRHAVLRASRAWAEQVQGGTMRLQTAEKYIQACERLVRYAAALGLVRLDDVTDTIAQAFIDAPGHNRQGELITTPADSTRRVRKSAVDALFATCRALGLTAQAPLIDLPPIPRSARLTAGRLTDADIDALRFHSERGMPQTRHAAVLGLLLSGQHTAEIGFTRTTDLDFEHNRVWSLGATRITARYCPLDDWAREVLRLRADFVRTHTAPDEPHTLATVAGSPAYRRQSSVCTAFGETARSSGTAPDGDPARPRDVTSWAAAKTLATTGQIADVALRFGLSSLDGAARLAGYEWRPTPAGEGEE